MKLTPLTKVSSLLRSTPTLEPVIMPTTFHRFVLFVMVALPAGCHGPNRQAEPFGKTYYLDGAGNLGFGTAEVPRGLRRAGYKGDVEIYIWTSSMNPLIDQLNILGAAEAAGRRLAGKIKKYKQEYPNQQVNIIALSAGTGVAVWACENLTPQAPIDNLVLLGSSLSYNYDMARAMPNIRKKIFVYYSPNDAMLGTVEIIGTIDRKTGIKSVGQVGMQPPGGGRGKVVNTPWADRWRSLGWAGGHTDCTNAKFVQLEIAPKILIGGARLGKSRNQSAAITAASDNTGPDTQDD